MASRTNQEPASSWRFRLLLALALAGLAAGATWWVQAQGYTLLYGDAQAHLNIARRVLDSRTPGVLQIGTVWLPLPHLLMMPLAGRDTLWANGLAGAIPASACFWLGTLLFFLALSRVFKSQWAGLAGVGAMALNPNLLYLQATPMTEAIFLAAIGGVFYGCVRYAEQPGAGWSLFTAVFALAGAMTRYDGWFLLPFVAFFLLWKGGARRWLHAALFCAVAGAGPLWWLGHNWWFWGDALEFYRGPYSAKAIYQRQLAAGMSRYPADGNWLVTGEYYLSTVRLVAGWPLVALGLCGSVLALIRGPRWAVALLLLPAAFYLVSMHNGGTPIFIPELWPHAHYNTRYGLALLPLLGLGVSAVVARLRPSWRAWSSLAVLLGVTLPWMLARGPEHWICWKESSVNSAARRQWLPEAADYVKRMYHPGDGILLSFGDLTGILEGAGISLKESLHEGNHPGFLGAIKKPRFFFHEEWALCQAGDVVAHAMVRAKRAGFPVAIVRRFQVGNAVPVEIWRRQSDFAANDLSRPLHLPAPLAGLALPGWGKAGADSYDESAMDEENPDEESDANTLY